MTRWARRLFVPFATLLLVLSVGRSIDARLEIDPLTAAQNKRLTFQTEDAQHVAGLTAAEIADASTVLDRDRTIADDRAQLLYLGNSQTLAIMDREAGDLTTPQWLQVMLSRAGAGGEVRLGSLPNMSTVEMLLQLVTGIESLPRPRCDAVVISLVLEEFRGVGIRPEMQELARRADVRGHLQHLLQSNKDLPAAGQAVAELLVQKSVAVDAQSPGERSWTDRLDDRLGAFLSRAPYVARRDEVVGFVAVKYMDVRNKLLGITSSTARPVPDPTYRANAEMLELILRYTSRKNVPVIVYLAPMRPIQPNPNLPADVQRFRRDMPPICAKYGATCVDYTDLVPETLWTNYPDAGGPTGGQRDFAHFTGAAHKLVAETMLPIVKTAVARAKAERARVSPL